MSQKFREELQKKATWNRQELLDLYDQYKPNRLSFSLLTPKVGDIFTTKVVGTAKPHPFVVLSVGVESCVCVCISSTPKEDLFLTACDSRILNANSFFTNQIINVVHSMVSDGWIGEYNNPKHLKEVKKLLKKHYTELLRITKKRN